jgi:large subunit ribosomal protein L20
MRIKRAAIRRTRKKKIFKLAKGAAYAKRRHYRQAVENVRHGLVYAFRHRRKKKGDFRTLWEARINAFVREKGISYSRFIAGLKKLNIGINRKMMADLAVNDEKAMAHLVEMVKK